MAEDALVEEEQQLVVFKLAEEEYAVSILQVQEIKRMTEITRVPHTPEYLKGVLNLRGSVLPVIDLKKRLGLPQKEYTEDTRIIIVKTNDIAVGLIVDAVSEVTAVRSDQIEPPQAVSGNIGENYISGVGKLENRLLILLKLDELIGIQPEG